MKPHSEAFLRRRKFLMVLPLLVIPFLALAFWSLGGGKGNIPGAHARTKERGLNLELPQARLQEQYQDKLNHYEQEKQNSRHKPNAGTSLILERMGFGSGEGGNAATGQSETVTNYETGERHTTKKDAAGVTIAFADPHEEKINQKLTQLEKAMQPATASPRARSAAAATPPPTSNNQRFSQDVDRLESMMQRMGAGNSNGTVNPEMQQLENMLERILDIQHPERVKQRLESHTPTAAPNLFALQASPEQAAITLLDNTFSEYPEATIGTGIDTLRSRTAATQPSAAFYGLQDAYSPSGSGETGNTLEAAIDETRTLTAGASVKMRLLQDASIGGRLVGKGSLIYGTCRINGERLNIEVTSVLTQNTVLPVALAAYDLDGQEGLYIPGAPTRDAAKQGADRAVNQSLQLSALNPSIGAQAASAGIDAARGLLSRQARQVKVTVTAGHRLLLRDRNPNRQSH